MRDYELRDVEFVDNFVLTWSSIYLNKLIFACKKGYDFSPLYQFYLNNPNPDYETNKSKTNNVRSFLKTNLRDILTRGKSGGKYFTKERCDAIDFDLDKCKKEFHLNRPKLEVEKPVPMNFEETSEYMDSLLNKKIKINSKDAQNAYKKLLLYAIELIEEFSA